MMRFILPLVVAFVVAAGGASGIAVLQAKRAPRAATTDTASSVGQDSTADSTRAEVDDSTLAVLNDSVPLTAEVETPPPTAQAKVATPIDSVARAAVAVAPPTPTRPDSVKAAAPETVRSPAAPAGARMIPTAGVFVGGRISKIFAAMPAKQAARILERMVDADVVQILGSVNDRKAAEIMALLPAPRAAGISRSVLARGPTGQ